jgi:NADH:ubiquinone oxidoreductase subunit 3 (subunit A)
MSIILAFAFEVGQAAVLFSLLTSSKDRGRIMPWVLMTMFTLVQVIGNIYSSYKYIILNSSEDLRFFKEPIFIWTDIPDNQANVIIVYLVGALLPIASLLLTSMITNYLTDEEEVKKLESMVPETIEKGPEPPIIIHNKEEFDKVFNEHENEEQSEEEIQNTEEETNETENDAEIGKDIQDEPIENVEENNIEEVINEETKEKEKSHFINL